MFGSEFNVFQHGFGVRFEMKKQNSKDVKIGVGVESERIQRKVPQTRNQSMAFKQEPPHTCGVDGLLSQGKKKSASGECP